MRGCMYVHSRTTIVFIHLVPKARVSMENNNKPIPCGLSGKKKGEVHYKSNLKPRAQRQILFKQTHEYYANTYDTFIRAY